MIVPQQSLNKGETITIERAVCAVKVATGSLLVSADEHNFWFVSQDKTAEIPDLPVLICALEGSNFQVEYTDVPVAELGDEPIPWAIATRGDSGGQTGSYESRTLKELRPLAKERGIEGHSTLSKTDLIEALRDA